MIPGLVSPPLNMGYRLRREGLGGVWDSCLFLCVLELLFQNPLSSAKPIEMRSRDCNCRCFCCPSLNGGSLQTGYFTRALPLPQFRRCCRHRTACLVCDKAPSNRQRHCRVKFLSPHFSLLNPLSPLTAADGNAVEHYPKVDRASVTITPVSL